MGQKTIATRGTTDRASHWHVNDVAAIVQVGKRAKWIATDVSTTCVRSYIVATKKRKRSHVGSTPKKAVALASGRHRLQSS